jgi:hypothetical protein
MVKVIRMAVLAVVLALNGLVPSALAPQNSSGPQTLLAGRNNNNNNNNNNTNNNNNNNNSNNDSFSVPEPASILLLGAGMACAGVMARRKHRKQ